MTKIATVGNHPNRSRTNVKAAANPSPATIIRAREDARLTQTQAAELLHTSLTTWQGYEAPKGSVNYRRMHPAFWELVQVKIAARKMLDAGELSPAHVRGLGLVLPGDA